MSSVLLFYPSAIFAKAILIFKCQGRFFIKQDAKSTSLGQSSIIG